MVWHRFLWNVWYWFNKQGGLETADGWLFTICKIVLDTTWGLSQSKMLRSRHVLIKSRDHVCLYTHASDIREQIVTVRYHSLDSNLVTQYVYAMCMLYAHFENGNKIHASAHWSTFWPFIVFARQSLYEIWYRGVVAYTGSEPFWMGPQASWPDMLKRKANSWAEAQ